MEVSCRKYIPKKRSWLNVGLQARSYSTLKSTYSHLGVIFCHHNQPTRMPTQSGVVESECVTSSAAQSKACVKAQSAVKTFQFWLGC